VVLVGNVPLSATYDSENGCVYVTNADSNNVSVIHGTGIVGTIRVGLDPQFAAYDSGNGSVYVLNYDSGTVSVISGTTLIGTVGVGVQPQYAIYDPGNGLMYISNSGSGTVSVISGTHLLRTIAVGSEPGSSVYDDRNGDIYVGNSGSNNVSVINGTSLAASTGLWGGGPLAYDAGNGYLYVADEVTNLVNVVDGPTEVGSVSGVSEPSSMIYDPGNGLVYVVSSGSEVVSIINGTAPTGSVSGGIAPAGMGYDGENGYVYVANRFSNNVSVIAGTTAIGSLVGDEDPYAVSYDSGSGALYVVNDVSDTVDVFGPSPAAEGWTYPITFAAAGLPSGTTWSATLNNFLESSHNPGITYIEPNGTYRFSIGRVRSYSIGPVSGTVTVDGRYVIEGISFAPTPPPMFNLTFTETGLPPLFEGGQLDWSVTLNETTSEVYLQASNDKILISVPNGTYAYAVGPVGSNTAVPMSGLVTVSGLDEAVSILFVLNETFAVTFTETGLPSGTNWSIQDNSNFVGTTSTNITVFESNGTYSFGFYSAGYNASPDYATFTVQGDPVSVLVTFTSGPSGLVIGAGCSGVFCGWTTPVGYAVLVIAGAAVIEGISVAVLYLRRTGPPPDPADRGLSELEEGSPPAL
jgi:DNA-binding beta-propeller fold protein YncE